MRKLLNVICICCLCSQMFYRLSGSGQQTLYSLENLSELQAMCQAGMKRSVSEAWRKKACGTSHL